MSAYSIGIIGTGAIISSHVEALRSVPGYKVIAACDIVRKNAEKVAIEFDGCKVYTDYQQLLQLQPDVVLVALPHNLHCRISCDALRAGCHVVVEKPMATSAAECREMLETANENGRILYVSDSASYGKGQLLTGKKFQEGLLGRYFTGCVIGNRTYDLRNRPAWGLSVKGSGGGMFANVGVHRLAIARACIPGLVPRTVSGWVSRLPQHEIEACTSAIVKYDGGGAMHYENTGYFGAAPFGKTMHFIFEEGIVAWEDRKWMIYNEGTGGLHEETLEPVEPVYVPFYRHFTRILEGDSDYRPKVYEYAVDTALAHAIYASSRAGNEINVLEPPWDLTDLQYLR
ncbi:MAG: Gfo/Idh/MocA family oxidoreductase [Spirochaetales bacterium]|jgi:predicted dehydrogenase|nr:Gfo/Idh/MocA family oxidoreductase [Spirochaetales bacterium]